MNYLLYRCIALLSLFMVGTQAWSQNAVLQMLDGTAYTPRAWSDIERITFNTDAHRICISTTTDTLSMPISESIAWFSGTTIPVLTIDTDEPLTEIPDKTNYRSAHCHVAAFGQHTDIVAADVDIRGRGNMTWSLNKKPYRLKFPKKISLCGLPAAKNYVLLANHTDPSMMKNAVAFYIGQLLDIPYTPQATPVDVVLNGIYKGSYLLTNKPGINAGSVDIDEDSSIMWELDTHFDEDLQFISPLLNLPVMAVDPDLTPEAFETWKTDFCAMEAAAVNHRAADWVDMDLFARYQLVNLIVKNDEVGFPKSVKLYKTQGGKYCFGPLWDYDVSMGYLSAGNTIDYFSTKDIENGIWNNLLFRYLEDDPEAIAATKQHWNAIKDRLPDILAFIDRYAAQLRTSALRNRSVWTTVDDFDTSIAAMKQWLTLRFEALTHFSSLQP